MKMKRNKNKLASARREGVSRVSSPEQAEGMRRAGRFAAELLDRVAELIRPGVTTLEIDQRVDELTRARGAKSAPLDYGSPPFAGHCCISANDVICHGIPAASHVLKGGDIVNVDVTPVVDGWHGDSSRTFLVGDPSAKARRLVADTYRALWLGVRAVKPGAHTGDIGHAIQSFAEAQGYSVVREFTGHGVGRIFHTAPSILHFGKPGSGDLITPGMTFTVEPMINLGHWKSEILADGWTAVTVDGSLSAQFEHTLLVTESGVEVLTLGAGEQPPAL